jgi:hypothetical protein
MINTITKNYVDGEFVSYQITYVNSNMVKSVPLDEANRLPSNTRMDSRRKHCYR